MIRRILAFMLTCAVASACHAQTITVAAAISLKDALGKIAGQYTRQTGQTVEFTFGSSGQLASQIKNGAPVDLFISAANKQVDDLQKAGVLDAATRTVVAGNALVLIVPAGQETAPDSTAALTDPSITTVAIGEPKSVPAGQYAEQVLNNAGVYDALQEKLVLGTNVRQVLDYVERGEVSAGFVYATDAKVSGEKVRVAFVVHPSRHEPIVYPAGVVSASEKRAAAVQFLDYILSDDAQAILSEFGFTPAPQPAQATQPVDDES